jgi:transcriptional regulator with XRE-family HTH domain
MEAATGKSMSLQRAREEAGLSREQLAELCGVTRAAVGHWETGLHPASRGSRLLLAQALHVPVEVVDGWFERREAA